MRPGSAGARGAHEENSVDCNGVVTGLASAFNLTGPAVAPAFAGAGPAGVRTTAAAAPSACSFWRRAKQGVCSAPADAHRDRPIGAMTMGFELPESLQNDVIAAVTTMYDAGYISSAEPVKH